MQVAVNLYFCPMEIDDALVEKLSMLARLRFQGDEKDAIKSDLANMIGFIDKLNELDTSSAEPLIYLNVNTSTLRTDDITGMCSRNEGLKNAPLHNDEFFKVPKVINRHGS